MNECIHNAYIYMCEHTCMNRHKLETDARSPKEYVSTEIQPCAFENEPTKYLR